MVSKSTKEQIREYEVVRLVCSQTNYTEEEALHKLKEKNNNYLEVIKDYMNPVRKPTQYTATLNQQIFKNIRGFLDSEQNNLYRRDYCEKKIEHMFTNASSASTTTNVPTTEQLTEQNKTNIINI